MKITKYEKARLVGARALQLAMGAPILLKLSKEDFEKLSYDPIKIAEKEMTEEVLPITIKRPMP
ncbi:MAG: DNA-directed RNA polymerase subunit K [Candidatus Woesearchaeota archaeon]